MAHLERVLTAASARSPRASKSHTTLTGPIHRVEEHADALLNVGILHARRVESLSSDDAPPPDQLYAVIDELIKTGYYWIKRYSTSRPVFYPGCTRYTIAVECGLHRIGYERCRNPRVVESLVDFGADSEEAFHSVTNSLLHKGYEATSADDPDGDGKEGLLAGSRSLLLKLLPLQQKPAQVPNLPFLSSYPGAWEEVVNVAESIRQTESGKKKRWTGLREVFQGRRRLS
ncbi:hypothetical protein N658DRAFT_559096 [Parathielavia hyrcaniae]|uniref:Uncharacterized protein n=1 Tax=Parathielavia hyrcaniae TaxID=113614 RepID=A0AAN6Q0J1_9PEZI|nr:hypothetical protein N658DRAFT_559096 [Parathielavia hyrcaniae]